MVRAISQGGHYSSPVAFALHGNYPNPFNPTTTLRIDLPQAAIVAVEVVDVLGRTVLTLPGQPVEAGFHREIELAAGALASGTYLYRVFVETGGKTQSWTGRMTLVK